MTLRFFTQLGKPDTRKIEYEQGIVRLGLEKSEAEREVGKLRDDISDLGKHKEGLAIELEGKKRELSGYDLKLNEVRANIALALKDQSQNADVLREEEKVVLQLADDKKKEIQDLNEYISSLNTDVENKTQKLIGLQKKVNDAREDLAAVTPKVSVAKRELLNAEEDVQKMYRLKKDAVEKTEVARKELVEIEAQIATLKRDNHGGLDAIASLEAERTRIKAREKGLDDKAADLKVYENRLIKEAKKLGVDLKMTFLE